MEKEIIKIIDFWQNTLKNRRNYPREVLNDIDLKTMEVVVLTGVRRSGKSCILNLIANKLNTQDNFLYLNFEDPFFIENNNPLIIEKFIAVFEEYFNKNLKYLFFDEVQNIKKWEKTVRKLRDSGRYKIFLTGSSSKLLSREISTLLTGRHLSYEILPLSFKEYLAFNNFNKLSKKDLAVEEMTIKRYFRSYQKEGGFPEIALVKNFELLKNYFYDILYKDIVVRHDIREKETLERIALFLLSNYSKIITFASIKNNYKISFESASNYVEYFKDSFLIFSLPQFSFSLKKQANLPHKNYVIDIGLANTVSFQFSENGGMVLENIVFLELKRRKGNIYYYKDKGECDFVVKEGLKIIKVIQVTQALNDEDRKREIGGLFEAMDKFKLKKGLILTEDQEDNFAIDGKEVIVKPVWKWLLE